MTLAIIFIPIFIYFQDVQDINKDDIEVCPSAGLIVQEICSRIKRNGGFCLLADYGHTGEKGDTFRVRHIIYSALIQSTVGLAMYFGTLKI